MTHRNRQKAWKRGQWGETVAALYLRAKGYGILTRQFRCPLGEVDIIARRSNTVIFVEVKTRSTHDDAAFAVSQRQRERIMRAAGMFMQNEPEAAQCTMRFDALLMVPWRWPVHLENAWQA